MAEIQKVYRETLPKAKIVGLVYGDSDRNQFGSFSDKWGEWFRENRFAALAALNPVDDAYLGAMRMTGENSMEYWIAMFLPADAAVPEGFDSVDFPQTDVVTAWVHGTEDGGDVYMAHEQCVAAAKDQGLEVTDDGWYFERYVCPRFTEPDRDGKVILDYCMPLKG